MNGLDLIGMIVAAAVLWLTLTRPASPNPRAGRPLPRAPRSARGHRRPERLLAAGTPESREPAGAPDLGRRAARPGEGAGHR